MSLSIIEFCEIIAIPHISMLAYSRICPPDRFLEFLFYSIPQYLVLKFLDWAYLVYLFFIGIIILIPKTHQYSHDTHTSPIDRLRMTIIFLVCYTIFAADFKNYDRDRLGKSMNRNFKLMDVGVASFTYNSGIVSFKAATRKKLVNCAKCLFFAILRLLSKLYLGVDVSEAEFGRHLNFFFDLAAINFLSIFVNVSAPFFVGLGLILVYQALLVWGLDDLIFQNARETFIMANIEGIVFLIPQFGLYLMARDVGYTFLVKKSMKRIFLYLIISCLVFFTSLLFTSPIRRLHNTPFCLLIFTTHTATVALFDFFNKYFNIRPLKITESGSRNMLCILVLGNLAIVLFKHMGWFSCSSEIEKDIKIQLYLMFLFYLAPEIYNFIKRFIVRQLVTRKEVELRHPEMNKL